MTPRDAVRAIWEAALAAGDVAPLVRAHLPLAHGGARVILLGAGKADAAEDEQSGPGNQVDHA